MTVRTKGSVTRPSRFARSNFTLRQRLVHAIRASCLKTSSELQANSIRQMAAIKKGFESCMHSRRILHKTRSYCLTPYFIEKVIAAEKVDAILLSFGGQTALNCGLELKSSGVLRRYGVRVLGTPVSTIEATEDRQLFVEMLDEIGIKTARSKAVGTAEEA